MDSPYPESGPDVTDGPIGTVVDYRGWHRLHRHGIFSIPDQSLLQIFSGKSTDGPSEQTLKHRGLVIEQSGVCRGHPKGIGCICQVVSKSV